MPPTLKKFNPQKAAYIAAEILVPAQQAAEDARAGTADRVIAHLLAAASDIAYASPAEHHADEWIEFMCDWLRSHKKFLRQRVRRRRTG